MGILMQVLKDALTAHEGWREEFKRAVVLERSLDRGAIAGTESCALGKWLAGPGKEEFGQQEVFAKLVEAHRQFHAEAGRIVEMLEAGRYDDAARMLWAGTAFALASSSVSRLIRQLMKAA